MKWGNCQEKSNKKRVAGVSGFGGVVGVVGSEDVDSSSPRAGAEDEDGQLRTRGWSQVGHKLPPVAVHPIRGVTPPTTAPTQVLITENRLIGV